MKKRLYFIFAILVAAGATWSCQKQETMVFNDVNRISLQDSVTANYTFIYEDASVTSHTFLLTVNTIGDVPGHERRVMIEQIPEYDITYLYDDQGQVTDTIKTEIPNMAVAGKHYISFDDTAAQAEWTVEAGKNTSSIPITLLRDASLQSETIRLRVRLVPTDDFQLGETKALEKTIVFSDRLLQPKFWDINITNYNFGRWSVVKHQFMIDVSGERIDDEWYNAKVNGIQGSITNYTNIFRRALSDFNSDPANIASGLAPMRDENNNIITM